MFHSFPSLAIALLSLPLQLPLADSRHAVGKFIVHVEKHEFIRSHPHVLPRVLQDADLSTLCSVVCSDVNAAATTCPGDSCFCAVLSASGSLCSECFVNVNETVAADLGSA